MKLPRRQALPADSAVARENGSTQWGGAMVKILSREVFSFAAKARKSS
jgi:hypothetical protein